MTRTKNVFLLSFQFINNKALVCLQDKTINSKYQQAQVSRHGKRNQEFSRTEGVPMVVFIAEHVLIIGTDLAVPIVVAAGMPTTIVFNPSTVGNDNSCIYWPANQYGTE